jgi:AcrR family transcriptional regulator
MNAPSNLLDLRVRRTYKFLWDALMALMIERDFESVTVTDICERAMVHRTTFYKHYEDKHGLLMHGIQDEVKSFFEALNLPDEQPAPMTEEAEALPRLIKGFEHVLRNERFYRLMLCGDGVGQFYILFRKSLVEHFLRRSEAYAQRDNKAIFMRQTLRAQAHAGMLVSAIAWWLENDCPYTPAEMGRHLWDDNFS